MLAAMALILCTVVLFKMKRQRYAWVTILPASWLVVCTVTAGLEKVFLPNPAIGFLAHASRYGQAAGAGQVLAPAKSLGDMTRMLINDYVDATLAALFVIVVLTVVVYGFIAIRRALDNPNATAQEIEFGGAVAGASRA
jgi:carbon starvation protein